MHQVENLYEKFQLFLAVQFLSMTRNTKSGKSNYNI